MHNEESTAEQTLTEIYHTFTSHKVFFEIIVVESGSEDRTANIIKKLSGEIKNLRSFHSDRREGYRNDLIKGLRNCISPKILMVDSGKKFQMSDLLKIYESSSDLDLVIGRRINRKDQKYRVILSRFYCIFLRYFHKLNFDLDADSGLSVISKRFKDFIVTSSPVFSYLYRSEMAILCLKHNYKFSQVNVSYFKRKGKSRGLPNSKLIGIIFTVLKDNFKLRKKLKSLDIF